MNAPGLRLHPLKGKFAGRYAANVDENFRVTFAFEAGRAVEVDYGDVSRKARPKLKPLRQAA
jgi:proteic killer suppression protein